MLQNYVFSKRWKHFFMQWTTLLFYNLDPPLSEMMKFCFGTDTVVCLQLPIASVRCSYQIYVPLIFFFLSVVWLWRVVPIRYEEEKKGFFFTLKNKMKSKHSYYNRYNNFLPGDIIKVDKTKVALFYISNTVWHLLLTCCFQDS